MTTKPMRMRLSPSGKNIGLGGKRHRKALKRLEARRHAHVNAEAFKMPGSMKSGKGR